MTIGTNNLGGQGPDYGEEEVLEFQNVGSFEGNLMNLRVKIVGGDYEANNNTENGFLDKTQNGFAQVNLKAKHTANMEFCFVDQSENPITLDTFSITFYDLGANSPDIYDRGVESLAAVLKNTPITRLKCAPLIARRASL